MMYPWNTGGLGFAFHYLHRFFGVLLLVGVILFVIWAVKYLSRAQLKSYFIWILVIGLAGTLLTTMAPFKHKMKSRRMHSMYKSEQMGKMMNMMKDHDEETGDEEHEEMEEMMRMMMDDTMKKMPGRSYK